MHHRPSWLKVRLSQGPNYQRVRALLRDLNLHSVCEEALCPNVGECFESRTATFLMLGRVCSRHCRFCAVSPGRPSPIDWGEANRVAEAVGILGLRHVVVTSVTRDDLPDGGSGLFASTIQEIREHTPDCTVEVLVPDFGGSPSALGRVLEAGPNILNHNVETVPRLYPKVRPQADYRRSLSLLRRARETSRNIHTKSGLMVGLGETWPEILEVLADLRRAGCDILTIGQYLRPSSRHLSIERYYTPQEFAQLKEEGKALGFRHVESAPLVRSSYHAGFHLDEIRE